MFPDTVEEKIFIKSALKSKAESILLERIEHSNKAMNDAQHAANDEGKSTVGDKHETSRSMALLDREIYAKQLDAAQKELTAIHQTDADRIFTDVRSGSVVITDSGNYFFIAGLGSVETENGKIIFLSINSPLGNVFRNKKTGDAIVFNNKTIHITGIF
jgi:hypothetical protein